MKDIRFCGRSLEELGDLPAVAKREAGYQLDRVQHGLEPTNWKPIPSIGSVVREIRIMHEGQYRVIYVSEGGTAYRVALDTAINIDFPEVRDMLASFALLDGATP